MKVKLDFGIYLIPENEFDKDLIKKIHSKPPRLEEPIQVYLEWISFFWGTIGDLTEIGLKNELEDETRRSVLNDGVIWCRAKVKENEEYYEKWRRRQAFFKPDSMV
jgi:hypothetical protein